MELKEALVIAEEIMNIVSTGQKDNEKNIREYICDKLDISEDTMIEAWYRISRRDE